MPEDVLPPAHKSHKAPVLVIDDNADQWFIIRWALLNRFPEVEGIWVRNDTETEAYLEECLSGKHEIPKLILLDLYLPDRQRGWNLLQIIKTHHLYREIPVVVLSQSSDTEDIRESYMFRSNSYIVKPGGYKEWLDCIASFRHYWWQSVTLPKHA